MASGRGSHSSQPGSTHHVHPDEYAYSQNAAQSSQEYTHNAYSNAQYPALGQSHPQLSAHPQFHQHQVQHHARHPGQAPQDFQSVQPDHYQAAHEPYSAYLSSTSDAPLTYQHPPRSYSASVPSSVDLVTGAPLTAQIAPVTALRSHTTHSNSPASPVSPLATSPSPATSGYQPTRTHGRYTSGVAHGQHKPYAISSSSHQHSQPFHQFQQEQHSHPQAAFRKRRTQSARISDESDGEGGDSDEGEVPLEKQVPGDISKLSTHSRRKIYLSGLEGYISDSREALRQKGVESPELQRAATSTGLMSATKTDLLAKGRGKVGQLRAAIEEQEAHLTEAEKQVKPQD